MDGKSRMIDTILFDLDNTLLDFNKAERIALSKTLSNFGIEPAEPILRRYSELNQAQWKLLELGRLSRPEVKLRRFQLLFDEIGTDCPAEGPAQMYELLLEIGHYFIDGAEELLQTLCKDYRLYLVTNGTAAVQKSRLKSASMDKYFQGIFISEELGFDKPSKEYFDLCFAQISEFQKQNTAIVGDSLTSDILGGKNAGIRTIWFHPADQTNDTDILPDHEIHHLKDLEALLLSFSEK